MPVWKKILVGTTIGAGITGIALYLSRLNRTGTQLESVTTAKIHSLNLSGLTIRLDVKLKNPTNGSLKLKFPFVKVAFKDVTIGTSTVINKDIELPKYGEANIEAIMVTIPATGLLTLGGAIYNLLTNKEAANILVTTISTIDLGWTKKPYEKAETITLNPMA